MITMVMVRMSTLVAMHKSRQGKARHARRTSRERLPRPGDSVAWSCRRTQVFKYRRFTNFKYKRLTTHKYKRSEYKCRYSNTRDPCATCPKAPSASIQVQKIHKFKQKSFRSMVLPSSKDSGEVKNFIRRSPRHKHGTIERENSFMDSLSQRKTLMDIEVRNQFSMSNERLEMGNNS